MMRTCLILLALLAVFAGCSAGNTEYSQPADGASSAAETSSSSPREQTAITAESEQEAETMQKELILTIDGTVIPVIWEDNASVAELTKHASWEPIHIVMDMYGGWEQVGSLGHSISRNDIQMTAHTGDIMLYSGNQIVLFYGENSWAYTKLGHTTLPEEEVTSLLSRGAVRITLTVS